MTRLRPLHTLLLLLGALSAGAAEPLVPGQFAQGFAIEAMQDGAIHRLALDERVYRALQRPDLGDLVVFNGSGEAVPQALEPASVPAAAETVERPLPFYPVGDDTSAETRSGLQVTVNTAGAVVSIAAPAAGTETVATPSWIIDAGENHAALRALRLQWSDATEPFLRPVTLYASSDLRGWNYQLQATLADLAHDGHQLRRDTLEFWGDRKSVV